MILMKTHSRANVSSCTLYSNHSFDVTRIIDNQRKIQLLGIYHPHRRDKSLLDSLKRLDPPDSLSTLPLVFWLDWESFLPVFDHLSIFRALYSNHSAICRPIALSFDRNLAQMKTDRELVSQVPFISETSLIRIAEDMAMYFPGTSWLNLWVEHPSRVVS
jgi:hypothetical protein